MQYVKSFSSVFLVVVYCIYFPRVNIYYPLSKLDKSGDVLGIHFSAAKK